jgi:7,8-dihydropterin-6-yl-methyl-4-(beta-D-ribofuranosyl)aminobenzene 5'-phosphate synthase
MDRLGIDPALINVVALSHPHSDHLGGMHNKLARQAILFEHDDRLAGKPHFSTVPLKVAGGTSRVVESPQVLAPGVATTGPLPVQLLLGYTLEQSLVVNVKGLGLVVIVGCGHPGLRHIVESAERAFKVPVYGIIGGLHYPVTQDRRAKGWFKPQKLFGNPNPPWQPISKKTVLRAIRYLKEKNVRLVSLSAHDSCDWAISTFAENFGDAYFPLKVGREINWSRCPR